jgi:hypothetical protein
LELRDRLITIAEDDHQFHGRRSDLLVAMGRLALEDGQLDEAHAYFAESRTAADRAILLSDGKVDLYWHAITRACRGLAATLPGAPPGETSAKPEQHRNDVCSDLAHHPKATSRRLAVCAFALVWREGNLPPFTDRAEQLAIQAIELSNRREALPLRSLAEARYMAGDRNQAIDLLNEALAAPVIDATERRQIVDRLQAWTDETSASPSPPSP